MNNFFNTKTATKTVHLGDESADIIFRQLPFGMIMKLHKLGGPLSKLLTAVLVDKKADVSTENLQKSDGTVHMQINEASPATITLRSRQLEEAIQGAFDAVLSPETTSMVEDVLRLGTEGVFEDDKGILDDISPASVFVLLKEIFVLSAGDFSSLGKLLPPEIGSGLMSKVAAKVTEAIQTKA